MNNIPNRYEELSLPGTSDTILAAVHPENGKLHFSPRHVCDSLSIGWPAQRVKIKADPVFSKGVSMIDIPSAGGPQSCTMLPVELLSGWLTTIKRVPDPATQARLTRYRQEAYAVLDA